jgi:hypothetical protein
MTYDSQGKLAGYNFALNRWPYKQSYFFSYDNDGRINRKGYAGTNFTTNFYTYDQKGRLIADSTYNGQTNSITPRVVFKYNDKDNLIEWQTYYYNYIARRVESSGISEVSHCDEINSFRDLRSTFYFINDENTIIMQLPYADVLSKNNISRLRYPDGTSRNYDYKYDSNGFLKKIIYNDDKEYYTEFFYE